MPSIRVFLADGQPIVRRGITLLLEEQQDIEVVGEAGNGQDAVESIQRLKPDVALMDIDLPVVSGLDATRVITETAPEVGILILTELDREDHLFQALQAGASGYILRDADVQDLMGAIRTVSAKEVFIHPRMATKLVSDFLRRRRSEGPEDAYGRLSNREREVLPLLAENRTNLEIGSMLHVSPYTVQTYRQRIMRKLDLHSRTELLRYALRRGLISLGEE